MISLPPVTLLVGGVAVAAGLFAWAVLERSDAIQYKADAATLRAANAANLATIERMEADQIINEAKAIADAIERREMEADIHDLEQAGATGGLGAIVERRRLQRERDRDRNKAGRP